MNRGAVIAVFAEVNQVVSQVKWIDPGPVGRMLEFPNEPDAECLDVGAVIAKRQRRSVTLGAEIIEESNDLGIGCRPTL
jgi:hypothetical protein